MDISLATLSRPKLPFRPDVINDAAPRQQTVVSQASRPEMRLRDTPSDELINTIGQPDKRQTVELRPIGDRTLKPYDTLMLPYREAETGVSLIV